MSPIKVGWLLFKSQRNFRALHRLRTGSLAIQAVGKYAYHHLHRGWVKSMLDSVAVFSGDEYVAHLHAFIDKDSLWAMAGVGRGLHINLGATPTVKGSLYCMEGNE